MLKINGRRIFNLTGQEIKLAAGNNAYMTIPSDGIVEVYYRDERSRWADPVQSDGMRVWVLTPKTYEDRYVDDVDDWFLEWDSDFIVPLEYYLACRELGLPTDRLYTVGEAIHDGKNIEGYRSLVKH